MDLQRQNSVVVCALSQLGIHMDVLEEYLKKEPMDAGQYSACDLQVKEEDFNKLEQEYYNLKRSGEEFLDIIQTVGSIFFTKLLSI